MATVGFCLSQQVLNQRYFTFIASSSMTISKWQRFFSSLTNSKPTIDFKLHKRKGFNYCTAEEVIATSPFDNVRLKEIPLTKFVFENVENHAEAPCATCGHTGRTYNYGMMRMLITNCSKALLSKCGLKKGDTVALVCPNIPEFIIAAHGILEAGLTVTFINPLYTPEEITSQFINANVKMIITIPFLLDMAIKLSPHLKDYRGTINIGGEDDEPKKVYGLKSLLTAAHEANLPEINVHDIAILPYSSGTTGLPKGVCLTHYNLVSNLIQGNIPEMFQFEGKKQSSAFTVLPFFHIYGFNAIMSIALLQKMHIVTLPKFNPAHYLEALEKYKPDYLFVVPSLLKFIAAYPKVTEKHLSSVTNIVSGAAPASDALFQMVKAKSKNPNMVVRQGYGMSETAPVLIMTPMKTPTPKPGTVGVLYPNTESKVVDFDTHSTAHAHNPGELHVRGPQVMKAYLNNPKATKETIDNEGWLNTGDVAYYDDDGYFFIVDRTKELIKVKGQQVSPTEMENLILEYPGNLIVDVAVVGIPHKEFGEVPKAFVVLAKNANVTEEDISKFVNSKVAQYKQLSGGIQFIDSIPRNISGKIQRQKLKKYSDSKK